MKDNAGLNNPKRLKMIKDLIWTYKDIANQEQKKKLKKILKHEHKLLVKRRRK